MTWSKSVGKIGNSEVRVISIRTCSWNSSLCVQFCITDAVRSIPNNYLTVVQFNTSCVLLHCKQTTLTSVLYGASVRIRVRTNYTPYMIASANFICTPQSWQLFLRPADWVVDSVVVPQRFLLWPQASVLICSDNMARFRLPVLTIYCTVRHNHMSRIFALHFWELLNLEFSTR